MTSFTIDLDVRADEGSEFVPSDLVAGAHVGDAVTVRSAHLDRDLTGIVAEVIADETRGRFHRVSFSSSPPRFPTP